MSKPTVFISYSHNDEAWKDKLLPHLKMLEQQGRLVVWDDRRIDAGESWYPEIREAMERAAVAVCLISANFLASDFCVKEEVPFLLGRREKEGMVLIPVLIDTCAFELIDWLAPLQMLPRDGKSVAFDYVQKHSVVFTEVARRVNKALQEPDYRTKRADPRWAPIADKFIDIERLPETGFELFGRQKELKLLDEAWESQKTNVVSLVAYGGVGKTTLVNKWLERLAAENYRGAQRVYAWSFYSQGTKDQAASADFFFKEALQWFGEEDPTGFSVWEKGERLAELIREQRTLLILDGVEPLQSGFEFDRGKIMEPALEMLISKLSEQNNGLCVITTREKITRQQVHPQLQLDMEQISPQAARALLRVQGVRGTNHELEQVGCAFGPHALAIRLLAAYLVDIPGQAVSAAYLIPELEMEEHEGKHARRVIAALEKRLSKPALELLRVMGLFDRPARSDEIDAVLWGSTIDGFTSSLRWLTSKEKAKTVAELRHYHLLDRSSAREPEDLDAHPLVREFEADQLRKTFPEAWKEGHRRLFKHLEGRAERFPETLEEMMPLYQAVAHGCRAGLHHQAIHRVYWPRILREIDFFSWQKLGVVASDLAAVSSFFEHYWDQLGGSLQEADQAFLFNQAGIHLRAMGLLAEAVKPLQAGLRIRISLKDWRNAAQIASNLCEVHLSLGNLSQAVRDAQCCVEVSERSEDAFWRMGSRATLANALHHAGALAQVGTLFKKAERIQMKRQPPYPLLYSMQGFEFCDFLLRECESTAWNRLAMPSSREDPLANCRQVRKRAYQTLEWTRQYEKILDIGLDNLTLGRTFLLEAALTAPSSDLLAAAERHLDRAVLGLRQASYIEFVARGLIARAQLYRVHCRFSVAHSQIEEAIVIASHGPMPLLISDIHLEQSRLHHAQGNLDQARQFFSKARSLIQKHAYHRRDRELEGLEGLLAV